MKKNNSIKNEKKLSMSLSSLIADNRFLMIISCVIAFGLWIWVAIERSPEVQRVITGVPVQINVENSVPEQMGLKVFGNSQFTIDVTVTGKKYIISSLTKDDIEVIANTNYVDGSGVKSLPLRITPKDDYADYVISSYSQNDVEVFFDKQKDVQFTVEHKIQTSLESIVPDGCIYDEEEVYLSNNTVTVSGPASEVNKITNVYANIVVDKVLDKTTTFETEIVLETEDGAKPEYSTVSLDANELTATIPVLKEVTLPTSIEFKNAPAYFIKNPLPYSIYPSKVKVAVPVDMVDEIDSFVVDTIDFSNISGSINNFTVPASSIGSYKILDKQITNFNVKIDASNMVSKTVTIPSSKISVVNSRSDYKVQLDVNRDITVKLIGIESHIDKVSVSDLSIVVNTSNQDISVNTESLQGIVVVSGEYACWAVNKYSVKVKVQEVSTT